MKIVNRVCSGKSGYFESDTRNSIFCLPKTERKRKKYQYIVRVLAKSYSLKISPRGFFSKFLHQQTIFNFITKRNLKLSDTSIIKRRRRKVIIYFFPNTSDNNLENKMKKRRRKKKITQKIGGEFSLLFQKKVLYSRRQS
uniref:Uncharacterized protein n=1 Tax=Cacopsylla melanoneura TaxID=428564 RepID=A0A8D8VWN9_9HEMI